MQTDDALHHFEPGLIGLPEHDVGARVVEQSGVGTGREEELGTRCIGTAASGHHQLAGNIPVGPSEDSALVSEGRLVGDRVAGSRIAC